MTSRLAGVGAYLPEKIVTGEAFLAEKLARYGDMPEEFFDIPKERRHANAKESSTFMGARACESALRNAGLERGDIDLLICFSTMPDLLYPKDGQAIAKEAGLENAIALDIDVACVSFIEMLKIGTAMIAGGFHRNILIVSVANWVNRAFDKSQDYGPIGDGAAAAVMVPSAEPSLIGLREFRDGRFFDFVRMASPSVTGQPQHLEFAIDEGFKEFVKSGSLVQVKELMEEAGVVASGVDWLITHQPGSRLMKKWCASLELAPDQLLTTYDQTGNCMAANIPLIMDRFVNRDPKIKRGDVLLFFALGSGFHGAAMLWRF